MKFAVCDIETTGGNNRTGKIIEIAIFLVEDGQVIDEFISLIHPERGIPPFITSMTGISEDMVQDAPKFYEVAARIVEITDGATFVAHNVSFDYQFIVSEFARLGYVYKREKACTLALSRKLIPGLPSYSLGNLCQSIGIPLNDRHRAAGDARATVELFFRLQDIGLPGASAMKGTGLNVHPLLEITRFSEIPETSGVYYFFDEKGNDVYIGKSNNLHRRVLDHFYNRKLKKDIRMQELTARIEFRETGSELVALLLESHEIKSRKPLLNRAGRRSLARFGIFSELSEKGYMSLIIGALTKRNMNDALRTFDSREQAIGYADRLIRRYSLCQQYAGYGDAQGPCFNYQIKKCIGACVGEELPESYNLRVQQAIDDLCMVHETFMITDGRQVDGHRPFVLIEQGRYIGFGFVPEDQGIATAEDCRDFLENCPAEDKDAHMIIQSYMRNKKPQIVRFREQEKKYRPTE